MFSKTFIAQALGAMLIGTHAWAAGFQLRYQSAEAMGTAFASVGTSGKALSHIYYNPASIFLMGAEEGKNYFGAEGTLIIPFGSEIETDGTGNTTDGFTNFGFAPSFFYARMLKENLALTVSLTSPWATDTDYDNDWDGRYQALETSLISMNLTSALSYKLNDKVSLTGGIQLQYLDGTLSTMVDGAGGGSGAADFISELNGDSFSAGATLGLLYLLNENTTMAFNYISSISNNLEGDVSFTAVTAPPGALPATINDAELEVDTPNIINFGLSHIFSEKLTGHFSANYVTWSSFESLDTKASGTTISSIEQDWKDAFFISAGATINMKNDFVLRTGLFYETGAPDDIRSPRTIDADKIGLGVGSTFKVGGVNLDLALNQIFYVGDFDIDLPNATAGGVPVPGTSFAGEVTSNITLIRAGITYNW